MKTKEKLFAKPLIKIRHLRNKYSLYLLFLIATITVLLTFLTLKQFESGMSSVANSVQQHTQQALYDETRAQAKIVITALAKNLANPFYVQNKEAITELLSAVRTSENVAYVYLYDAQGRIISDGTNENSNLDKILTDEISKNAFASVRLLLQRQGDILDASIPIYRDNQRLGGVRVGFSLAKIQSVILGQKRTIASLTQESIKNTVMISVFTSIFFLALGMFFALKLAKILVQPLLKLNAAANEIGKGNLTVRVDIKSGDELQQLANSFNQMTSDLSNHQKELAVLHESAKQLSGNIELEHLLDTGLMTIKQILKATKGSIMLIEDNRLIVKRIFGWKTDELPREKGFSLGEGVAGDVAKSKKAILANDVNEHPLFVKEQSKVWRGCRDLLCVPIVHEDKIKGVINIQDRLDGRPFTPTDLGYAEIIASSTGLSLANIALIQQEKAMAQRIAQAEERAKYTAILEDKNRQVEAAYQELKTTQRQLIQSEKMATVGTLAGGMAHEINTPLGTILNNAEMLLKEVKDKEQRESLHLLTAATKHCRDIVRVLLKYSHPAQAEFKLIQINQVIEEACALLEHQFSNSGIAIHKNYQPLPEIIGSANELEQVITNLLLNSKDAILKIDDKKRKKGNIYIRTYQKERLLFIEVEDDGCGIPEQDIHRVFDPFFTTKDVGQGTGLGLSVSQRIIEQHNGQIKIESELAEGSKVIIELPISKS